ncbi:MAG: lytic transglycosylase domain-containing protein [Bryobacteraceae bacterium]|nr:lytic transglycosylase domain-containing protein [Bryobacteraceae bacterium]
MRLRLIRTVLFLGITMGAPLRAETAGAVKSTVRVDPRTGRLVRVVVVPPAWKTDARSAASRFQEAVESAARRYALDPALVHAVIEAESNYNPYAVSPKGAEGLMQLMPPTARRFGVANSFNFAENLQGGVRYLRYLLDLLGDERLAVAAYNAGEKAVIRYGGIPPFPETRAYVQKVTQRYQASRRQRHSSAPVAPAAQPEYRPVEWAVDANGNLYLYTR